MLGPNKIKELADLAFGFSKADQTEVIIQTLDSSLSRFANNYIHQNVFESNGELRVRVVLGKRTGISESNDLSPDGIRRTVETARAIAQLQPENPDNQSLAAPIASQPVNAFVQATADCSPEMRARVIESMCKQAAAGQLTTAGAFRADSFELGIANSLGTSAYHSGTIADLHVVVMTDTGVGSGYASEASPDVRELDGNRLVQTAMDKARRSRESIGLTPGEYTVVLEPYAVANLMQYLGMNTFTAQALQEGRSYVKDRFGDLVFSPQLSLYDDGLSPKTFALPFDHEGVPRQRVDLVEQGVARDVVYDTFTARKAERASTGHSLPAPNTFGPLPRHLFVTPGPASTEELIRSVTTGVLITRFWYTRVVHPLKVTMTGLSRDGTFLIEHGEVTQPIKNLRFTTSYIDALKNIRLIGRDTKLIRDEWNHMNFCAPAMVVDGFNFTGVTQ